MFDETPMEQFIEDTILDGSPSLNNCKSLSNNFRCFFIQVDDAFPSDDDGVKMIQYSKRSKSKSGETQREVDEKIEHIQISYKEDALRELQAFSWVESMN